MITFAGPITANLLSLTGSGALTNSVPCFLHDTPIRTDHGDVAVRDLRIGDHVITLDSSAQPIKWIGRRSYTSAFAAGNDDVIPIEIQAGAIADNVPDGNLIVSPGHAIIHAAGAPAETYMDCNNRGMFHNAGEYAALYPNTVTGNWTWCAPRVEDGPAPAPVLARLAARAGIEGTDPNVPCGRIAALRALGWDVELIGSREVTCDESVVTELNNAGIRVYRAPEVSTVEELLRRRQDAFHLVYLHRLSNAEAYSGLVRAYQRAARVVYSVADLHHIRVARPAAVQSGPELADEARSLRLREFAAMRMADAARWLAEAILPPVWQARPDIPCYLVGCTAPRLASLILRTHMDMDFTRSAEGHALAYIQQRHAAPIVQPTRTAALTDAKSHTPHHSHGSTGR